MSDDDLAPWRHVGELLVRRRVALSPRYRNRTIFAAKTGQEYRMVFDVEKGKRSNYTRETIASMEHGYRLRPGAIHRALAHLEWEEFPAEFLVSDEPAPVPSDKEESTEQQEPKIASTEIEYLLMIGRGETPDGPIGGFKSHGGDGGATERHIWATPRPDGMLPGTYYGWLMRHINDLRAAHALAEEERRERNQTRDRDDGRRRSHG